MARQKKVEVHEATPPTWEEPLAGNKPLSESLSGSLRYNEYENVTFKELVEAHEKLRVHLKRTLKAYETLESIIKRERIEVENILAATQVT